MRLTNLIGKTQKRAWYIQSENQYKLPSTAKNPNVYILRFSSYGKITTGTLGHCLGFLQGYFHHHHSNEKIKVYKPDGNLVELTPKLACQIEVLRIAQEHFRSSIETHKSREARKKREKANDNT